MGRGGHRFQQHWHRRRLELDDGRVLLWLFIDDPRALAPHVEAVRWEDGGPLHPDDAAAMLAAARHPDAVHVPTVEVGTGRFH